MFADDASARQCSVLLLLLCTQLAPSSLFLRGLALAVQFLYPLIAFIASTLYRGVDAELAALEELAIGLPSLAYSDTYYFAGLLHDDEL